jgi:zinc transporter ZupT
VLLHDVPPGLIAAINGLSAGSFLYVGMVEILAEELHKPVDASRKVAAVTAGLVVFASLALLPDGD